MATARWKRTPLVEALVKAFSSNDDSPEPLDVSTLPFIDTQRLSLDQLHIAARYNRDVTPSRRRAMAQEFDFRFLGGLVVARRKQDGTLHVIDGQHRYWVIYDLFGRFVPVPCFVIDVDTYEEEAEIYTQLNKNRRNLSATDAFRGRLESRDPVARSIWDALKEGGFTPTIHQSENAMLEISSFTTSEILHNRFSREHLVQCVSTLVRWFPSEQAVISDQNQWMMSDFLRKHASQSYFNLPLMERVVESVSLEELKEAAISLDRGDTEYVPKKKLARIQGGAESRGSRLSYCLATKYDRSQLTKGLRKLVLGNKKPSVSPEEKDN